MAERLWKTRTGGPADAPAILNLRRATFGDVDRIRMRPEVWRWQFVDNPAGAGYIRLAEHDGRIVGQYAAIATRFRVAGAQRLLAMSCDTMTHPDYQRQGMFVTLARELYAELAERQGVTTVWGFPNAASHPGFVERLDWFDVHEFPTWVKPMRSRAVLRRYLGSDAVARVLGAAADRIYATVAPARAPRRAALHPLMRFDERFAALWERHAGLAPVVQVRDPTYLAWRYLAVPDFGYEPFEVVVDGELAGYVVLRVLTLFDLPFAAVVDLFPCPIVDAAITREVLGFAERHAAARGAAFLTVLLPPPHDRHLRACGFLRVPRFLKLRPWYLGARCAAEDRPRLGAIDNWYVTYGDADII